MGNFQKFAFSPAGGTAYELVPIELQNVIPFDVRRVYYITGISGNTTTHMHYEEEELFILQRGTCTAIIDKGNGIEEMPMKAHEALYVPHHVWHGFKDFSSDALLLALSSTNYRPDRSDYLEDYDAYLPLRDEYFQQHGQ